MEAMGRLRGDPSPLIRDVFQVEALRGCVRLVLSRTLDLLELAYGYEEVGLKIECGITERGP